VAEHATAAGRASRGFTLLEVMCAFAILAMVTSFLTQSFHENFEKAERAIARREVREAGDTIFRRILYELQEHQDGKTGSLEEFYAGWCRFKGHARERWRDYSFELSKKVKVAAGSAGENDDAEPLFSSSNDDDDESDPDPTAPTGADGTAINVVLTEVTVHIRLVGQEEPVMTLTTLLRTPPEATGQ
jgi:prepilin-type N-terminal cleavage/methylation domain-containing protein